MVTQIVYSEEFQKHDTFGHPENAKRLSVMMDEIKNASFYKKLEFIEPEILPEEILYDVHSKDMVDQVKEFSLIGDAWIDLDTYISLNDFETARLAAGGLAQICNNVLNKKALVEAQSA